MTEPYTKCSGFLKTDVYDNKFNGTVTAACNKYNKFMYLHI